MASAHYHSANSTITLDMQDPVVAPTQEIARVVSQLATLLAAVHAAVPLANFLVKRLGNIDSDEFRYEFTAADGRQWKQKLRIPPPPDEASMSFIVPQQWKLSEFAPHREVRDVVIALIVTHKAENIEFTW
jgi:hypothetical protein